MAKAEKERCKELSEYDAMEWTKFKEKVLDEYKDRDETQQMMSVYYLQALARHRREKSQNLDLYLRQFRKAATYLIRNGAETNHACCRLFLSGLPKAYADKVRKK